MTARLEVSELQRAEPDALETPDPMADALAHPLDLTLAALVDRQLEGVRRDAPDTGGRRQPVLELHPVPEGVERPAVHRPGHHHAIGLRHLVAGMGQPQGELTVVGQQDQARGVDVQAPDRVEPRAGSGTSEATVGRPCGSRAVETTPAGLLTA